MSTRSCLAVAQGDGWKGVYCHSSGYSTWMGRVLWEDIHQHDGDLQRWMATRLTAHIGGWSSFPDLCYCHEFESGAGEATCDSMEITDADEAKGLEPFFTEWVYVVSPRYPILTILTHVPRGDDVTLHDAGGRPYTLPAYRWARVGQYALDGAEPNWEAVETSQISFTF